MNIKYDRSLVEIGLQVIDEANACREDLIGKKKLQFVTDTKCFIDMVMHVHCQIIEQTIIADLKVIKRRFKQHYFKERSFAALILKEKGHTSKELGKVFGCTGQRVLQLVSKGEWLLRYYKDTATPMYEGLKEYCDNVDIEYLIERGNLTSAYIKALNPFAVTYMKLEQLKQINAVEKSCISLCCNYHKCGYSTEELSGIFEVVPEVVRQLINYGKRKGSANDTTR